MKEPVALHRVVSHYACSCRIAPIRKLTCCSRVDLCNFAQPGPSWIFFGIPARCNTSNRFFCHGRSWATNRTQREQAFPSHCFVAALHFSHSAFHLVSPSFILFPHSHGLLCVHAYLVRIVDCVMLALVMTRRGPSGDRAHARERLLAESRQDPEGSCRGSPCLVLLLVLLSPQLLRSRRPPVPSSALMHSRKHTRGPQKGGREGPQESRSSRRSSFTRVRI